MDESRKVYGIDLGTTYSCIAQIDEFDKPVVLKNFDGLSTTPSVVYFPENVNEDVMVGVMAKEQLKIEPEKTVSFIKRYISEDSAYDKKDFPRGLDPTEISAFILKKIVKDANDAKQSDDEKVEQVVITCPAYFGTKERERTKQAGEIAGLKVLAVINEPTAAAIAYGMNAKEDKTIMVYDLGGGTFDVTIIRVASGTITVVATGGDHHLGGVDWDEDFAKYLLTQYNNEASTSIEFDKEKDPKLYYELMGIAEDKKKTISGIQTVKVIINPNQKGSRTIIVTRDDFNKATEFRLDETIDKTREVIEIAKEKGVSKIDEWLLVGGSSRMTQIKERVDKEFGCNAKLTDPDECVAKGAAIYAVKQAFSSAMDKYADGEIDEKPKAISGKTNVRVVNVTSKSYGLGYINRNVTPNKDWVHNMVSANTPLPYRAEESEFFCVPEDGCRKVNLPIYESDSMDSEIVPEQATLLENYTLTFTKYYKKDTFIKVVYEISGEGILCGHAEVDNDSIDFELKLKGVKTEQEKEDAKNMIAKINVS
ncbi:MAG: Hsp70 family protein [Bacteroidales bacterium]|jgi:molecular chaperone DnaK (HSP70)|nr:Hsp70 family protein [Bacteroidales bacterium]